MAGSNSEVRSARTTNRSTVEDLLLLLDAERELTRSDAATLRSHAEEKRANAQQAAKEELERERVPAELGLNSLRTGVQVGRSKFEAAIAEALAESEKLRQELEELAQPSGTSGTAGAQSQSGSGSGTQSQSSGGGSGGGVDPLAAADAPLFELRGAMLLAANIAQQERGEEFEERKLELAESFRNGAFGQLEGMEWVWWSGVKGFIAGWGQGILNILNGLTDGAIGLVNLPAEIMNHNLWLIETAFGIETNFRWPTFRTPDWSKGLLVHESDTAHAVSKFVGALGVELLSGTAVSKLGHVLRLGRTGKAAGTVDDVARLSDDAAKAIDNLYDEARELVPRRNAPRGTDFIVTPRGVVVSSQTLARQGTSHLAGNFQGLAGKSMAEIIERVPSGWKMVPQDRGLGIKFLDEAGFERIRMHGPSPRAPAGSNSANGWTLRIMDRAGNYYDDLGRIVPYRANDGHIPMFGNPNWP